MTRPYALFRTGFPYIKTIGMRRITSFPMGLVAGDDGNYYVLCRGELTANIRRLSWDDEDLGAISDRGTEPGKLMWPVSIAKDSEGHLYVSDEALHRISVFTIDGDFVSSWGVHGTMDGELDRPSGIAFDPEGNLYVVDTLNHRVQKFTRGGEFISSFGGYGSEPGQLDMPWGVTVDELGEVYVADWRNDRVQKFTPDGDHILTFGSSGSDDGQLNRPTGVEVDADGDVYVADWGNDRVQLFDQKGRYVEKFIGDSSVSRSGIEYLLSNAKPLRLREMAVLEPQKRFRSPTSVMVDADRRMFVSDYGRYRIQIYRKEAIPLSEDQIVPELGAPTLQTT